MDAEAVIGDETQALAAEVEALVRATPGVRDVYRSGSLVTNVIGAGAAALGVISANEPLVAVARSEAGVAVAASVGIDFGTPAAATLRAVHEAIDGMLLAKGLPRDRLRISVVYVQSREGSTT